MLFPAPLPILATPHPVTKDLVVTQRCMREVPRDEILTLARYRTPLVDALAKTTPAAALVAIDAYVPYLKESSAAFLSSGSIPFEWEFADGSKTKSERFGVLACKAFLHRELAARLQDALHIARELQIAAGAFLFISDSKPDDIFTAYAELCLLEATAAMIGSQRNMQYGTIARLCWDVLEKAVRLVDVWPEHCRVYADTYYTYAYYACAKKEQELGPEHAGRAAAYAQLVLEKKEVSAAAAAIFIDCQEIVDFNENVAHQFGGSASKTPDPPVAFTIAKPVSFSF